MSAILKKSKYQLGNVTFRTEHDVVDVTPIQEPDPNWKFRDKQLHAHVWRMGADIPPCVPTVKYVEDSPGTEDHAAIGHHECRICGEHVEVGFMSTMTRKHATGLSSYFINDEEVSKEKYDKIYAEVVKRCG